MKFCLVNILMCLALWGHMTGMSKDMNCKIAVQKGEEATVVVSIPQNIESSFSLKKYSSSSHNTVLILDFQRANGKFQCVPSHKTRNCHVSDDGQTVTAALEHVDEHHWTYELQEVGGDKTATCKFSTRGPDVHSVQGGSKDFTTSAARNHPVLQPGYPAGGPDVRSVQGGSKDFTTGTARDHPVLQPGYPAENSTSAGDGGDGNLHAIIGGVLGAVILVAVLAVVFILWYRKRGCRRTEEVENPEKDPILHNSPRASLATGPQPGSLSNQPDHQQAQLLAGGGSGRPTIESSTQTECEAVESTELKQSGGGAGDSVVDVITHRAEERITRTEERITRAEEHITRNEERITRNEERITRVECNTRAEDITKAVGRNTRAIVRQFSNKVEHDSVEEDESETGDQPQAGHVQAMRNVSERPKDRRAGDKYQENAWSLPSGTDLGATAYAFDVQASSTPPVPGKIALTMRHVPVVHPEEGSRSMAERTETKLRFESNSGT